MNEETAPPERTDVLSASLKKTLNIICGKWRLYIILQLGTQPCRYSELRRMIPDVSEKVLVQELRALATIGVVEKIAYPATPLRVEYGLTAKGLRALPLLLELTAVGEIFLEPCP